MVVVAVDLNGDGLLDILSKNYAYTPEDAFSAFLGGPGGTFGPDLKPNLGMLQNLIAGDFTGDGKQDLAGFWSNGYTSDLAVLPGNGDGTFGEPILTPVGFRPWAYATGDFNGDGRLDLVAVDYYGSRVGIFQRASTPGTFLAPTMYAVGSSPVQALVVDLNGDGLLDVVTVNSNDLSVLLGSAQSLQPAVSVSSGAPPARAVFADFNGDGNLDLAVYGGYPGVISILLGNGSGGFSIAATLASSASDGLAVGDFNGDGRVDLATCPYENYVRNVQLWLGTGDATLFAPGPRLPFRLFVVPEMFAADLDGDGDSDLVLGAWDNDLQVLRNTAGELNGVGISAPAYPICPGTQQWAEAPDYGPAATYLWSITNGYLSGDSTQRSIGYYAWDPGIPDAKVALDVTIQLPGCPPIQGHAEMGFNPAPQGEMTAADEVCPDSTGNTASVPDAGEGASYEWSLYNGTITSGEGTREITFTAGPANSGIMNLYCSVRNAYYCSGGYGKSLYIRPQAWFQILQSICVGGVGSTTVEDQGPGATYTWSIADGTILSGQGTPTVTYSSTHAPYTDVTLTVRSAAGCSASWTTNLFVYPPPSAVITSPATVCAGSAGNVASVPDAGTGATYQWNIANGTLTSNRYARTVTYTAGPSGTTTLSVIVGRTSYAPCTTSSSRDVAIDAPAAVITAPTSTCASATGAASVVDAGAGASYTWTITNGTITGGAGSRTVTFTAGASGSVSLGVTVQNASGCSASGSQNIAISAQPSAAITGPAATCASSTGNAASVASAGTGATYAWTITNGTITGGTGTPSITFTAGASGPVGLSVTVQTTQGCSASGSLDVAVSALPSATITAPAVTCAGSSNAASVPDAGVGASYTWTITNGTITSGAGTRSITFTAGASGAVSLGVTVRSSAGCQSSGATSVTINGVPSAAITAAGAVCAGSAANAASVPNAGAGATYAWTITGGTITSGAGTSSVAYTAGTGSSVVLGATVQSVAGCAASGTQTVTVNPRPSAAIAAPSSIRKNSNGSASVPSAGAGATYAWTISNGTITGGAGTANITFRSGSRGTMTLGVTVTTSSGCAASGSVNVTVTN